MLVSLRRLTPVVVAVTVVTAGCATVSSERAASGACRRGTPEFAYTAPAKSGAIRQSDVAVFAGGRQSYLTTDGLSQHPAFSPDGTRIVFASGRGGSVDFEYGDGYERLALFTADSRGGDDTRLTDGPFDTDPDWSPDGSKVVFVRHRERSYGHGGQEVWTVDVATGQEELLLRVPREHRNVEDRLHSPVWSPDGRRIAYAHGRIEDPYFRGPMEIWVMDADGSNARRVVADIGGNKFHSPGLAWSPDGASIAFNGLRVWDLGGRRPRALDESGEWPAWSPDGSQIAYWDPHPKQTDTGFRLTLIDPQGRHKRRVDGAPVLGHVYGGLDWSPCD